MEVNSRAQRHSAPSLVKGLDHAASSGASANVLRLVLSMVTLSAVLAARAEALDSRLSAVRTFAFALGVEMTSENLEVLTRYDLVVVDGAETGADSVALLKSHGALVLAYLSVGTIEKGRSWYRYVKPYRMELWSDWDEWYAEVNKPGFRNVMLGRVIPPILAKGFDGLFLDNVDMIQDHRRQRRGMYQLVTEISSMLRAQNALLFTQNGERVVAPISGLFDGWNREDATYSYDFENGHYIAQPAREITQATAELMRMRDRGLLVTTTDYIGRPIDARVRRAAEIACGAGAVPFVSNIALSRLPADPLTCLDSD